MSDIPPRPILLERWLLARLPGVFRQRLQNAHTSNKAAIRAMFWLVLFVLAAKLLAAGKEMAIAWRFGVSAALDGFLLTFNLTTWLVSIFYSVMGFVLVPRLVRSRQSEPAQAVRWQRQMTAWVWLGGVGLSIVCAIVLPWLLATGWLGLSAEARAAAQATLPWLAGVVALGLVAAWHACQLMSAQRHANTFLEAMPALATLIAVLVWSAADVTALWVGTLAGFALQMLLTAWAARAAGMPIAPQWPKSGLQGLSTGFTTVFAAQLVLSLSSIADQFILAYLPAGSLSAFGYANRVAALLLSLSALVLGRALLPILSGQRDPAQSYGLARGWARRMFWLGLAGAAVIVVLAEPAVRLLYERGAFTPADTREVALLLALLALQLPLYLVGTVWVQWLLTRPRHGPALWWAALAGTAAKMATTLGLIVGLDWRASAVAVGLAAATVAYGIVLMGFVRRDRAAIVAV